MRYVFDLDGTICTQQKSGEYYLAEPIPEMISKIKKLKNEGHDILIFTARGMNSNRGNVVRVIQIYEDMTKNWLQKHDVPYDQLIFGKPAGDVYVDDKGVRASDFLKEN